MSNKITRELLDFINSSPSCYHAVDNIKKELIKAGFTELTEGMTWTLSYGKKYFVTRNSSSIIAFSIPGKSFRAFNIAASHSDSPTFKIKENAEIEVDKQYVKLNVEKYGGMLCAPWFDRPLSIAGRVVLKTESIIESKLVNIDRDLLIIPNLAIHMNREANDGVKYNVQTDMLPLFGDITSKDTFMKLIAQAAGTDEKDILGTDLFLYNRMPGTFIGAKEEYIAAPRLDDLQCAYSSLKGFLNADNKENINVFCVFDNEEVGSGTKQGALSTFLMDTLKRINDKLGKSTEEYYMALASSFMLSADNAHAVHPDNPEKSDPTNRPYMNGGIVIKYNANQKYTTDAVSAAIFKQICEKAKVPYQIFTNRSDMTGGSTLGNLSNTKVSVNTVDIGLAQLAMHSPYETAGAKDTDYMIKAITAFYKTSVEEKKAGVYTLR